MFWTVHGETFTRVTLEPCQCEVELEKVGLDGSGYASHDGETCDSNEIHLI